LCISARKAPKMKKIKIKTIIKMKISENEMKEKKEKKK
jgi:hypothetical protein